MCQPTYNHASFRPILLVLTVLVTLLLIRDVHFLCEGGYIPGKFCIQSVTVILTINFNVS